MTLSTSNIKKSQIGIKGYLPVRVRIPPVVRNTDGTNSTSFDRINETIFYVKEHQGSTGKSNNGATLFVVNAPFVPFVHTKLILKSIFGRYGEVVRVTVLPNNNTTTTNPQPLKKNHHSSNGYTDDDCIEINLQSWTNKFQSKPTYVLHGHDDTGGRFAHVVFQSNKEMKRVMKTLIELMMNDEAVINTQQPPAIEIDSIEIQTLADETERQLLSEQDEETNEITTPVTTQSQKKSLELQGIFSVAERYRMSIPDRNALLEECNTVMEQYELEEARNEQERLVARNQPDADGFVTVTYSSTSAGTKHELEENDQNVVKNGRGRAIKRSRGSKKKKGIGATELQDFYRFQTKDNRKKALHELRHQFEQDIARINKLKEERQKQQQQQYEDTVTR